MLRMPTSSCLKGWHNVFLVCIYANEGQRVRRAPEGVSFVVASEESQQAASVTTSTTTTTAPTTGTTNTTKHEVISLAEDLLVLGTTTDKRYLLALWISWAFIGAGLTIRRRCNCPGRDFRPTPAPPSTRSVGDRAASANYYKILKDSIHIQSP